MNYALRDSSGQFVARARSKESAHRASRTRLRAGSSVSSMNMAKLSARGRRELARVSREKLTPESALVSWEKTTVALMSDGSVLEKSDVRFKPDQYDPGGRRHSYGWTVKGKVKAGLTPRQFVEIYEKRGFVAEGVTSVAGDVEVRSEKKAAGQKRAAAKRAAKAEVVRRAEEAASGPGFYVTNGSTGPQRVAELGPYATLDEALPHAWERLRGFLEMKFTYLLPVQVVEAASRDAAERGVGHVWWTDGKGRGAPVPTEQVAMFNQRRSRTRNRANGDELAEEEARAEIDAMAEAEAMAKLDELAEEEARAEAVAERGPEELTLAPEPAVEEAMVLRESPVEATFAEPLRQEFHVSVTRLS
jgi:hypothetical protein